MENNNKNKVLIYGLAAVVLIAVAVFLITKKSVETSEEKKSKTEIKTAKLEITDLVIEPEIPTSTSIIRINPVLNRTRTRTMVFQYRWFVNGEEMENINRKVLPQGFFKKDDRIFCQVKVTDRNQTSKEMKSRTFTVGNSPPRVQLERLPKIKIPGNLVYQIHAYDPDNDSLVYNLISPLDKGIQLDSKTGLLKWYIQKLPEKREIVEDVVTESESSGEGSGEGSESSARRQTRRKDKNDPTYTEKVMIVFEVRDSSGDRVRASFEINLKTGREIISTF